jgi:hypothetical protein
MEYMMGRMSASARETTILLFDELRAPLLRYLFSLRLSLPDSEEIVQEVFLALYQHLRKGKPETNLKAWTFTVAHNAANTAICGLFSGTGGNDGRRRTAVALASCGESVAGTRPLLSRAACRRHALPRDRRRFRNISGICSRVARALHSEAQASGPTDFN